MLTTRGGLRGICFDCIRISGRASIPNLKFPVSIYRFQSRSQNICEPAPPGSPESPLDASHWLRVSG